MKSVISADGKQSQLEQEFMWYPSSNGSDGQNRRPSDSYLFRPAKSDAIPIKTFQGPAIKIRVYKGNPRKYLI